MPAIFQRKLGSGRGIRLAAAHSGPIQTWTGPPNRGMGDGWAMAGVRGGGGDTALR